MNSSRVRIGVIAGVLSAIMLVGGVVVAAGGSSRSAGPDYRYGASAFDRASARVHVVKTGDGKTIVTLHITGVKAPAGQKFGAHVHTSACGATGVLAGPHYLHSGATGSLEQREIWLDFTVNAAGNGHAVAIRPWSLDESVQRSVILHLLPTAPDGSAGARLACIDLDGVAA